MVSETERDLISEDESSEQEALPAVELSETEGTEQEPDAATLRAELEEARRERDEARAIQGGVQRQLRAQEVERQRQNQEAARRVAATNREELKRQLREDPEAAERLAAQLDYEDAAAQVQAESMQAAIDRGYQSLMSPMRFNSLSLAEKAQIDQGLRQRYMTSGGDDFNADLAHEFAAAAVAKETKADELKTLREKVAALEAAQAGNSLRNSGGPERSMEGGGGGRLTPKSYAEKLKRGEVVSPEEIDAMTAAYL